MNIYNDSQFSSQASYPTTASFQNINTENIVISNSLSINGAQKGQILICEDNTNDIGGLDLGDQDFILCSDKNNTDLPIWRNDITVNKITTNLISNIGVQPGDLLVGDQITPTNIARLPIGPNGYILFSNGVEPGWQSLQSLYSSFYFPGSLNNVSNVLSIIVGGNGLSLTAGQQYLATVSARVVLSGTAAFTLKLSSTPITTFNYSGSSDMSRSFLFTSPSAGAILIEVEGLTTSPPGSLLEFFMWVMPF